MSKKRETHVITRKYRPQLFSEVLGQDAIITTLRNAIKKDRIAQAYLFCGARGTGKTTLARLLAKALNCPNRTDSCEPCNNCSLCKEITSGHSLDVLEIDGASHRGIDDIRQINETVAYSSASGEYKIYIIDEVHMLTKDAFNALLKTLEEPPPNVKFLFATTEPQKVLPTILSRCQRFNLNRIPNTVIAQKLRSIAGDLSIQVDDQALSLLATLAEGGLRDAESLFDQVSSFTSGAINSSNIEEILGIMPKEQLFTLDCAITESNLAYAFELSEQVFACGKDSLYFVETMMEHFRNHLLSSVAAPLLSDIEGEHEYYHKNAERFSQEQCLHILDILVEAQRHMKFSTARQVSLEITLINLIRSQQRIPVTALVQRLIDLEKNFQEPTPAEAQQATTAQTAPAQASQVTAAQVPQAAPAQVLPAQASQVTTTQAAPAQALQVIAAQAAPAQASQATTAQVPQAKPAQASQATTTRAQRQVEPTPPPLKKPIYTPSPSHDNLFYFAAVELEGTIKKGA